MAFLDVILPVFLIVTVGWVFGRTTGLPLEAPSLLTLYVFTPCLFFYSMLTATLVAREAVLILAYSVALFACVAALAVTLARIAGYPMARRNALVLSTCFPNSGNYGLPIILFAFSQAGFDRALVFAVVQVVLVNSAGVYFASRATRSIPHALRQIVRFPGFLAIVAAVVLRSLDVTVPEMVLRPVTLLGQAAIPTLLVVLGMQLGRIRAIVDPAFVVLASTLKLVLYPLVAYILVSVLFGGFDLTSRVLVVIAASPASVSTTLLAARFRTEPELVAAVSFITTVVSFVTVGFLVGLMT